MRIELPGCYLPNTESFFVQGHTVQAVRIELVANYFHGFLLNQKKVIKFSFLFGIVPMYQKYYVYLKRFREAGCLIKRQFILFEKFNLVLCHRDIKLSYYKRS